MTTRRLTERSSSPTSHFTPYTRIGILTTELARLSFLLFASSLVRLALCLTALPSLYLSHRVENSNSSSRPDHRRYAGAGHGSRPRRGSRFVARARPESVSQHGEWRFTVTARSTWYIRDRRVHARATVHTTNGEYGRSAWNEGRRRDGGGMRDGGEREKTRERLNLLSCKHGQVRKCIRRPRTRYTTTQQVRCRYMFVPCSSLLR